MGELHTACLSIESIPEERLYVFSVRKVRCAGTIVLTIMLSQVLVSRCALVVNMYKAPLSPLRILTSELVLTGRCVGEDFCTTL